MIIEYIHEGLRWQTFLHQIYLLHLILVHNIFFSEEQIFYIIYSVRNKNNSVVIDTLLYMFKSGTNVMA